MIKRQDHNRIPITVSENLFDNQGDYEENFNKLTEKDKMGHLFARVDKIKSLAHKSFDITSSH